MPSCVTMTFLRVARTGACDAQAHEIGVALRQLNTSITRIHLAMEARTSYGHTLYVAKIELSLPSAQIFADSLCSERNGHEDIDLAMQAAYDNAARQLRGIRYRGRLVEDL